MRVVPLVIWAVLAVLACATLIASAAYFLRARTARYLKRQREQLMREVGVLQAALLPDVPAEIAGISPSVAYRPADGPAAGGDFYDAFPLDVGRLGIVVGDICGHGRDALMRTSLLRHTLRAYLDAGLEPRAALRVASRVLGRGRDELATVIVATYDPRAQLFRYAAAGHPPPIFLGRADHEPVTRASSPLLGAGVPTGLRQTTVAVAGGTRICLFTDGLIEARSDGRMLGRRGLIDILEKLGDEASAERVIDRVAAYADVASDDMALCLLRVAGGRDLSPSRVEELEVRAGDADHARRFLVACGVGRRAVTAALDEAATMLGEQTAALLRVTVGKRVRVEVLSASGETFAAAALSRAAG